MSQQGTGREHESLRQSISILCPNAFDALSHWVFMHVDTSMRAIVLASSMFFIIAWHCTHGAEQ